MLSQKASGFLGRVVHGCNLSAQVAETGGCHEFEASLSHKTEEKKKKAHRVEDVGCSV